MFEFASTPEELIERLREAQDRSSMEADNFKLQVKDLFESLDVERVVVLRDLLHAITNNDQMCVYFQGVLTGLIQYKFGVCGSCGRDHEAELLDHNHRPAVTEKVEEETGQMELPFGEPQEPSRGELMEKYNMMLDEHMPGVRCKGCGTLYVSLEDRMLRKPESDGCPGCIEKAKWG